MEGNLDAIKDIDDTAERHLLKCGVVYVPSIEESLISIDNFQRLQKIMALFKFEKYPDSIKLIIG